MTNGPQCKIQDDQKEQEQLLEEQHGEQKQLLEEQHSKQELFYEEAEAVHISPSLKLRFVDDKDVEEIEDIARKQTSEK